MKQPANLGSRLGWLGFKFRSFKVALDVSLETVHGAEGHVATIHEALEGTFL